MSRMAISFPEEVLEHVFSFIDSENDRNSVCLVCKSWYEIERWSRRRVFVGNCYAVSPGILTRRFPDIRSIEIKGKPHFADFNLVPDGWGAYVYPWISAIATAYPLLEEIRLKRMVVSDEALEVIAKSLKNLKLLVLSFCEGFSTDGLAAIAASCRNLRVLDLLESEVDDLSGHWLSHFPDTFTSLVSINMSCLSSEVNFSALERLVGRCPNLKTLKLNRTVPLERLAGLLRRAPQLAELGTGACSAEVQSEVFSILTEALSSCKQLKSLSGFWDVVPGFVPAFYPVCCGLTMLNFSYASSLRSPDLIKIVSRCPSLQRLLVLDHIEDAGLEALAIHCKDLRELRVFPSDPFVDFPNVSLTEQGLVSISQGCPKLQSVLYFCRQMTNNALVTISQNSPNMIRFRLCIIEPHTCDYQTLESLDTGFGSIVENCKHLRRLSLSGRLTDRVFEYIGIYGKNLEMLSVAFAGESDQGLHYVLSGCEKLRKLEIRDCPFGDTALLANAHKLETMRSLWMSSCLVTYGACKLLGQKMKRVNVEVIDERGEAPDLRPESCPVEKLYMYRSVAGPRLDMPGFVWTMDNQDPKLKLK